MNFGMDQLPGDYSAISEPHIRDAVGALSAARAALDEAKKAHTQCELELPASEYKDAEVAAEARAAGKPEPRTRTHTAKHQARLADLAHELKTCEVMQMKAGDELEDAIENFGDSYAAEIEQTCSELAGEWRELVEKQIALHAKLQQAFLVRSRVIPGAPKHVGTAAVGVKASQIGDLEVHSDQHGKLGWLYVAELLALLYDLGQPKRESDRSDSSDDKVAEVDLTGIDQMSAQDALAGAPTQEQVEQRAREWDAKHAR